MINIPSFTKAGSAIQKLMGEDMQTQNTENTQKSDRTSLPFFFKKNVTNGHLTEGQFLLGEPTANIEQSLS
jgi:hypothetical protein